jgi:hypothetical protein
VGGEETNDNARARIAGVILRNDAGFYTKAPPILRELDQSRASELVSPYVTESTRLANQIETRKGHMTYHGIPTSEIRTDKKGHKYKRGGGVR